MDRRTAIGLLGSVSLATALPPLRASGQTASLPYEKRRADVNGSQMAMVDQGQGRPIVFLHGNPTSSFLWRGVMTYLEDGNRLIAPDLIGMGDSGKPDIAYTYDDHAGFLHALLDALDLQDVVLVIHDWGSALGLHWARKNPERIAAVAFMEAILPPTMPAESYEAMGPQVGEMFRALRTPGVGEEMVLEGNFFVDEILQKIGVATPLSEDVMAVYRAPFQTPQSRRPTLQWPREIPIGGMPANTARIVQENGEWLATAPIPKLLLHADPGALIPPQAGEWMTANYTNLQTVLLGPGAHFLQEDYPDAIGIAIADWLTTF